MEDDAVLQVVFFNKRFEFWRLVVMDDVQLKVVALLAQTLNDTQDTTEVLGLITQGGDMEDLFFPDVHVILYRALHVIPAEACA